LQKKSEKKIKKTGGKKTEFNKNLETRDEASEEGNNV
jgi:hypothetical protein